MDELLSRLEVAGSEAKLEDLIQNLNDLDSSLDQELDSYISARRPAQDHSINRLDLIRAQLGTALTASHELHSTLSNATIGAKTISSKVRIIDSQKSRVDQALGYVQDTIHLQNCIVGIDEAVATRDWERAATCVHEANQLDPQLIDGSFARAMVPTSEQPDFPRDSLSKAAETLSHIFHRDFLKAAQAKDMPQVTRYFKLFPLIGQEKEGLDVYAKFVCSIITTQSRTLLHSRTDSSNSMFYSLALSRLFENIALIVDQHAPVVERHYGKGKMARVVGLIQTETDTQGGLIADTFWDERRVARLLAEINTYAFSYLSLAHRPAVNGGIMSSRSASPAIDGATLGTRTPRKSEDEGVNLREVSGLVNEASVMLHRWSLYKAFLAARWKDYDDSAADGNDNQGQIPKLLTASAFNAKVSSRLVPALETLSVFVLRRSVEKAFQLDELPDTNAVYSAEAPLVSSNVDDVMFIFNTLVHQIISTGELTLIKNVLADFRRVLESDFVGVLQQKLRDEAIDRMQVSVALAKRPVTTKQSSADLLGLSGPEEKRLRSYLVYMNDLAVSASYLGRILGDLDLNREVAFPPHRDIIRDVLTTFAANYKVRCNTPVEQAGHELFRLANSRLKAISNLVTNRASYMVAPGDDSADLQDDVSLEFGLHWDQLMLGFKRVMAPENFSRLYALLASQLSRNLERWIWSLEGKVNELGAIRLDRDVGRIITKVCSEQYRLRDRFVRVAQLVMIIGLDDAEEEADVSSWALKDDDRVKARKIRVDRS